ncbi:RHS repeat-associated core domain-containing protein [Streptomyces sp. RG80]|uniref:RHS repeat domain-containing protein n=1 Tax=Streptomyces sp. RG80 TaxID=3157340 RepID=UPI00338E0137
MSDPDKGMSTMEYDVLDQLTKSTEVARGKSILTGYDELGRVIGTWDGVKDDGHQLTARTYDSLLKGQPASTTRYVGGKNGSAYTKTVTGYDTLDRPTATTLTLPSTDPLVAGGAPATVEFSSSYRLDGTLGSNKEPAVGGLPSEVIEYTYTPLGQVESIIGATGYLLDADYSALGRAQQYTLGTANTEEHKKVYVNNKFEEGTGRLIRSFVKDQTHSYMLMDLNYTFDQAGNITAVADPATLGGTSTAETQCYGYDGNQRLVRAWTPSSQKCDDTPTATSLSGPAPYWTDYTYNSAGQRVTEVQHAASGDITTTYCYKEGRPHTLSGTSKSANCASPDSSYGYDTSGNTTKRPGSGGDQALIWSSEGRLAELTDDGKKTDYLYDADGDLLIRSTENGERILYAGSTELHLKANGSTWAQRTYSSGSLDIAVRTNQSGNNKLFYLAGDHQGTQTLSVSADSAQAFTKRRTTPFGAERGATEGGSWPDDKGFLGKTKDTTTGLTHLDAREYDPKIGQFISVDPVMETDDSQSLNGYSYAANNPVTTSDPTGRTRCDVDPSFCGPPPNPGPGAPCPSLTDPQCPEYGGGGGGGSGSGGSGGGGGGSGGSSPVYGPASCGAPPLPACGPVYGPPSQPPLLLGPDPAPILSFSANCGIESEWNYLCNAGNGLMTSGTYLQEGFNRSSQLISQSARDLRNNPNPSVRSQAGKTLRSLQTHPGLQRVGAIGRSPMAQAIGSKVLVPGGIAFTGWSNYNSTGGNIPLTVAETAADYYVVLGATKVGANLGAAIGTAFGPGGTVVGAAIGGAGGAVTGILMTGPVNNFMSNTWRGVRGWFD